MYKIEFNDEMTLEGIFESFKNLKEAGIDAYIEIDGIRIYSNDISKEAKIKDAYEKHHAKHKKTMVEEPKTVEEKKKEDLDVKIAGETMLDAVMLSHNRNFKFELGTVLEYTKDEYKKMTIESKLFYYGCSKKNESEVDKYLNYEASILLILASDSSKTQKRFQISQIINNMCINEIERTKYSFAIQDIINYTIYGDELEELLYTHVLDEVVEEKEKTYEKIKKGKQS